MGGRCAWQSTELPTLCDSAYGFRCAKNATDKEITYNEENTIDLEQFSSNLQHAPIKTAVPALNEAMESGSYRWLIICDRCGRVQGHALSQEVSATVMSLHERIGCRYGSKEYVIQEV